MKTVDGKIVFATEDELYTLYLSRGMDDCMDFHEYINRMIDCGVEIEHSFELANDRTEIIMLLRLGWLEAKDRYDFWRKHPNVSLITLRDRPKFIGNGTDFAAYGWFIWSNRQQFVMPCVAAQAGEGER